MSSVNRSTTRTAAVRTGRLLSALGFAAVTATVVAVSGAGSAAAAPTGGNTCYFYRGSDNVVSVGPLHVGIADGNCDFVTFGRGFPGVGGHTGTFGIGNVYLGDGKWVVAEVDDVLGVAHHSSDTNHNMPF